jgi:hypothetical protein
MPSDFKNSVVRDNRQVFEHLYTNEDVQELFRKAGFRNVRLHSREGSKEMLHVVSAERAG